MAYGWDFLWTVAASSVGTSLLIGVAAYLGRSQISHWLAKDLEQIKAKHQRDLEAYKVSLIVETERVKASQEVKKASALRVLDKKFAALDRYHKAVVGLRTSLSALAAQPVDLKTGARYAKLSTRVDDLKDAENELDLFCSAQQRQVLLAHRRTLLPYLAYCLPGAGALEGDERARLDDESGQSSIAASDVVVAMMAEMQALQ